MDNLILWILVAIFILMLLGAAFLYIMATIEEHKEEKEYNKSLFRYLRDIDDKILSFHNYKREKFDEVQKEFHEISYKILKLDNRDSGIKNMRLIDSLTYHEKNALLEVEKTLGIGIMLTDEKIQNALVEITKGLNKHYMEFCNRQTADVEEETYILKMLEQKEKERLEIKNS